MVQRENKDVMPYVTVRGRRWFYEERGDGFPVLFGHGYLWDHHIWDPQAGMLSSRFRCICPDLWSHGESDPLPAGSFSLDELAQDHLAFMRILGIQRFGVVGHSVGGMWGVRLAVSNPGCVAALALMNTAAGSEPDSSLIRYSHLLDEMEKNGAVTPSVQKAFQPLYFSPETLKDNPSLSAGFTSYLTHIKRDNIPGIVMLGRAVFGRSSFLPLLEQVQCPTLVLAGECDSFRPVGDSELTAKSIPGARVHVIPAVGHMTTLEAPLQVSDLLNKFLTQSLKQ